MKPTRNQHISMLLLAWLGQGWGCAGWAGLAGLGLGCALAWGQAGLGWLDVDWAWLAVLGWPVLA